MSVSQIPGQEWPDPQPLDGDVAAEPFPTDALPQWLAAFIRAESVATQVPEDMAGMLSLSALSTAAMGKMNALANSSEWTEIVTLYCATVMAPGQRKSAIFEHINEPLLDWESEVQDRERYEVAASQQERRELEHAVERLETEIGKARQAYSKARRENLMGADQLRALEADIQAIRDDAVEAATALSQHDTMVEMRLVSNDLTPEAAAKEIHEQRGNRLSVISDEGGVFEVLTGARYGERLNLDIFLKGHSGNLVVVDRVSRERQRIRRPAITLGLAVQPNVLHEIGKSRQMYGRGLLARFLYAVPDSPLGSRMIDSPAVPPEIASLYASTLRDICEAAYSAPTLHTVPLTDGAQEIFWAYQQALEPRLTPEQGDLDPIIEWASKLNGAILRIAALIALARERAMPERIEEEDMQAAVSFSDYLINHAFRAHALMGLLENTTQENRLIRRLRSRQITEFYSREMFRDMNMSRHMNAERFEEHLTVLERMGYLRRIIDSIKPPRHHWAVNPKIFEEDHGSE